MRPIMGALKLYFSCYVTSREKRPKINSNVKEAIEYAERNEKNSPHIRRLSFRTVY